MITFLLKSVGFPYFPGAISFTTSKQSLLAVQTTDKNSSTKHASGVHDLIPGIYDVFFLSLSTVFYFLIACLHFHERVSFPCSHVDYHKFDTKRGVQRVIYSMAITMSPL